MTVQLWLQSFAEHWINKDIDSVLSLFAPDVEYWENPFTHLENMSAIRNEWQAIEAQDNIQLDFETQVNEDDHHAVRWALSYTNDGREIRWAGLYVLHLNNDGLCDYFYQVGEKQ